MPQSYQHHQQEDHSEVDFIFYTDGGSSGKTDFGGSAAVVYSKIYSICKTVVSGETLSGAYRSELSALLQALHAAVLGLGRDETEASLDAAVADNGGFPLTVIWYGDNKACIDAVNGHSGGQAEEALWAMLKWYLQYFSIKAVHIKRNSLPQQAITDSLASGFRVELKAWYELMAESGAIVNGSA